MSGKKRGGYRARAGRPKSQYETTSVVVRRCRLCGQFASAINDHKCPVILAANADDTDPKEKKC